MVEHPKVRMETSKGTLLIELFPEHAPGTVANFLKLVNQKFYDGLAFHRVIPDFVVQGGDPYSKNMSDPRVGTGGPGWKIKCETDGNPLTHKVGAISMAHAGKDTGGSQFFIVLSESNTRHLNGVHTVFAQVTDGVNLIPSIRKGDRMIKVEQVN